MDTEEYRKDIERKILAIFAERLSSGKLSAERSEEIAKAILEELKPHASLDNIYNAAQSLDQKFPELIPALLPVISDYETKVKALVLEHTKLLIQQGKIEEANTLLKKATENNLKLGK